MAPLTLPEPEHLTTWPAFLKGVAKLDHNWIFRGDLESRKLMSSLERACGSWGVSLEAAQEVERRLLREFQRHPEAGRLGLDLDDHLCWYTAMQHYGAPTRLLDWTYSPFVAAHFAFDRLLSTLPSEAGTPPARAAVWALNTNKLTTALKGILKDDWVLYQRKDSAAFRALYVERSPPVLFMGVVNPLRLNERLSVQQGVFLCPGDVRRRWIDNLTSLGDMRNSLKLFVMEATVLYDAFNGLVRMNVTARSLFPGLDGYAKSLLHRFKFIAELPIE